MKLGVGTSMEFRDSCGWKIETGSLITAPAILALFTFHIGGESEWSLVRELG
jgi:hypothetical protein